MSEPTNTTRSERSLPSRIVLGSASPRRRELLMQIGIEPIVVPAHIDESAIRHHDPVRLPIELAQAKALAVAQRLGRAQARRRTLPGGTAGLATGGSGEHGVGPDPTGDPELAHLPILAADTVVATLGEILEKPTDLDDAARMLRMLSGRTHQVVTGLAVIGSRDDSGGVTTRYAESHVTFAELSEDQIIDYLDSNEWQGVAGAYRIQGVAARFITHLSGSYSNVVGLPLHLVSSILTR